MKCGVCDNLRFPDRVVAYFPQPTNMVVMEFVHDDGGQWECYDKFIKKICDIYCVPKITSFSIIELQKVVSGKISMWQLEKRITDELEISKYAFTQVKKVVHQYKEYLKGLAGETD